MTTDTLAKPAGVFFCMTSVAGYRAAYCAD